MHVSTHMVRRREIVFFDPANPRSISRLVPELLAKRLRALWESEDAYLLGMGDHELRRELSRRGKTPSATDTRIRLQFWLEFERIQGDEHLKPGVEMDMSYVIGFAMAKEAFYSKYILDNCALAWILCPPVSYVTALDEALRNCMTRLVDVINSDFLGLDGKPSDKMISFLLKVDKQLYDRYRQLNGGADLKEIDSSNDSSEEEIADPPEPEESDEDFDKRMAELEKALPEQIIKEMKEHDDRVKFPKLKSEKLS